MKTIVCVDKNWGIGREGKLLIRIPEDMKRFKEVTTNNAVIMGRKTMESLNCKPLPNRLNIVLTRDYNVYYDGFVFLHSEKELIRYITDHDLFDKSYVIGGAQIYKLLEKYCMYAIVSIVDKDLNADTFIDNLDKDPNWVKADTCPKIKYDDLELYTYEYINTQACILFYERILNRQLNPFEKVVMMSILKAPTATGGFMINSNPPRFKDMITGTCKPKSSSKYYDEELPPFPKKIKGADYINFSHISNEIAFKKGDNIDDTQL